jgi:hypothetical protein
MWFADKLGPAPRNTPQAHADGPAKTAGPAKDAKGVARPPRAAAPQPSRPAPAPAPEPEKKKKGWF